MFPLKSKKDAEAEEAYLARFPWTDPTLGYPSDVLREGVVKAHAHIAVSTGSTHKSVRFLRPIHDKRLERVDGKDWELFCVHKYGDVDGVRYAWGMYTLGLGAFDVQVVVAHCRKLLPAEREAWRNQRLQMVGSHTGKPSYTLGSGVLVEDDSDAVFRDVQPLS